MAKTQGPVWKRMWSGLLLSSLLGSSACVSLPQPQSVSRPTPLVLDETLTQRLLWVVFDAARADDLETVEAYLQAGFSPNVLNERGDTLLTVAAYHGSEQVVKRLLAEQGLDIEARNRMGLTALSAAAFKGYSHVVEALLAAGADVNASNGMHQSPLMFAALTGQVACVKLLLKAGAERRQRDRLGNTASSVAAGQGAQEVVELLEAPLPLAEVPERLP